MTPAQTEEATAGLVEELGDFHAEGLHAEVAKILAAQFSNADDARDESQFCVVSLKVLLRTRTSKSGDSGREETLFGGHSFRKRTQETWREGWGGPALMNY